MGSSLAARLEGDDRRRSVTAFPDGSVDRFYSVSDGDSRIGRREAFGEAISTGRSSAFTLRQRAVEPGGHAVNAAVQADMLGDDVALVGHLDASVFADLSFETVSMGDPARADVYEFEDGDVLAVEPSDDVEDWSLADLRNATGDAFEPLLSADAAVCTNWTTFDAIPSALADIAASDVEGGHFVFDPGAVTHRTDAAIGRLFDALGALSDSFDVILAANGEEVASLSGALGGDAPELGAESAPSELTSPLDRLRSNADLAAAVFHEAEAAAAATPEGSVRVENFDVEPVRHTGGGDRFDAGLVHALARNWSWTDALKLGNACASRYVETGESATADELAAFLRERD